MGIQNSIRVLDTRIYITKRRITNLRYHQLTAIMKLLPALLLTAATGDDSVPPSAAPRKFMNKAKFMTDFKKEYWWWNEKTNKNQPQVVRDLLTKYFDTWFPCGENGDQGLKLDNDNQPKANKIDRCIARKDGFKQRLNDLITNAEKLRDGTSTRKLRTIDAFKCVSKHLEYHARGPSRKRRSIQRGQNNGIYNDKFEVLKDDIKVETDQTFKRVARLFKNMIYYNDDEKCQQKGLNLLGHVERIRYLTMFQWCELYHRHQEDESKIAKGGKKMCKDKIIQTNPRQGKKRMEKLYGDEGKFVVANKHQGIFKNTGLDQ